MAFYYCFIPDLGKSTIKKNKSEFNIFLAKYVIKNSMKHSRRKDRQIYALRYFKRDQIIGNGKE